MDTLHLTESILDKATELAKTLGILAIVVLLLVLAVYFLPTILSVVRDVRFKAPIVIANLLTVFVAFQKIWISLVIWLVLMVWALVGKTNVKTKEFPDIVIKKN